MSAVHCMYARKVVVATGLERAVMLQFCSDTMCIHKGTVIIEACYLFSAAFV